MRRGRGLSPSPGKPPGIKPGPHPRLFDGITSSRLLGRGYRSCSEIKFSMGRRQLTLLILLVLFGGIFLAGRRTLSPPAGSHERRAESRKTKAFPERLTFPDEARATPS